MKITKELLITHDACEEQVELFEATFPKGGTTSKANLIKAARAGLYINWLERFVPAPARKVYYEAVAAARKVYRDAAAPAWKVYDEAVVPALATALRHIKGEETE